MHDINFDEVLEKIVARDPRYTREAYLFVREALDFTQKKVGKEKPSGKEKREDVAHIPRPQSHVSGQQLLQGIRDYALHQYGPMAMTVLTELGVHRCEDFGEIVFNMVEGSLLAKTDKDTRADFAGGYNFEEAFRRPFLPQGRKNRVSAVPLTEF